MLYLLQLLRSRVKVLTFYETRAGFLACNPNFVSSHLQTAAACLNPQGLPGFVEYIRQGLHYYSPKAGNWGCDEKGLRSRICLSVSFMKMPQVNGNTWHFGPGLCPQEEAD